MSVRILVCSDTHRVLHAVTEEILTAKPDRIFHLGDLTEDAALMQRLTGRSILAVRGNNDYADFDTPWERVVEIEGFPLLLTHGHRFGIYRGPEQLCRHAAELGCRIALYGHTHAYACGVHGSVLYLNPGAAAYPRGDGRESVACLTLQRGAEPLVERVEL